ncbi:MAG: hypothetical protein B7Z40_01175 [Bosea sp. 12-68-7]|nr:MAG: hypothetical protein B7Z40_01175 [Bosea sp. 12-68-7]
MGRRMARDQRPAPSSALARWISESRTMNARAPVSSLTCAWAGWSDARQIARAVRTPLKLYRMID